MQKNAECQPSLRGLIMAQKMKVSTGLGLVDGERVFKIASSVTLLQKFVFLSCDYFLQKSPSEKGQC